MQFFPLKQAYYHIPCHFETKKKISSCLLTLSGRSIFGKHSFSSQKNEKNKNVYLTIKSVILREMAGKYYQSIGNLTLSSKLYSNVTIALGKAEILWIMCSEVFSNVRSRYIGSSSLKG